MSLRDVIGVVLLSSPHEGELGAPGMGAIREERGDPGVIHGTRAERETRT
jgi:hypothetical protein